MFAKSLAQPLLGNEIFQASYLYQICTTKRIRICPNQHPDLLRFHLIDDSLKINIFIEFFDKKLSFVMLNKLVQIHYQIVFTSQVIQ